LLKEYSNPFQKLLSQIYKKGQIFSAKELKEVGVNKQAISQLIKNSAKER